MPPRPRVTLYYDVVSPFARFAYKVLERYEKVWDFELVMEPRWLGAVMIASGNQPPANLPNRGAYMHSQDIPLISQYLGLKHQAPAKFPFNTLKAMRFLRAVRHSPDSEKLEPLSAAIWDGLWNAGGDISQFPAMIPSELLSPDKVARYVEESGSEENKAALRRESEELVAEGAFGFPWMIVQREDGQTHTFFGSDRFELMAYFLGKKWEGPFPSGTERAKL